jgi:MSHA biogenesis protein MshI
MRWPWQRTTSTDLLVVSWDGQSLAYVQAKAIANGTFDILKIGVEQQGSDSPQVFVERIKALNLRGARVHAVLKTDQYQLLQIDAPAVPPEEMRAAARYQIREMVESHIDDITIDVMRVGDGKQKGNPHLFVVVAANSVLRDITDLAKTLQWPLAVVDIADNAQRNLQSALALRDGLGQSATAALVVVSERQAVLTISANEELYYSRRLELPEGFLAMEWGTGVEIFSDEPGAYTPVGEYVPDYGGEDSYTGAYGGTAATAAPVQSDADRAQRLVVEVQRSLDLWDRTWSSIPLTGLRVYAGARSFDLAAWLSQEIGQTVTMLEFESLFTALADLSAPDQMACVPLLGALLRNDAASK